VAEDAHREDALRLTGDQAALQDGATQLMAEPMDALVWACTSGSFVFGFQGARRQAAALEAFAGVPTSSTSLAFLDACRHLGVTRVALAATYPMDVVELFVRFLAEGGLSVVARTGAGIITGMEVGTLERGDILGMVAGANHQDAEAILIPDTAMHSIGFLEELDQAAGKPVLTANQVSIWQGLRMAGHPATQPGMGALFAAATGRRPG
jgi:maleate cis-trans isomerase